MQILWDILLEKFTHAKKFMYRRNKRGLSRKAVISEGSQLGGETVSQHSTETVRTIKCEEGFSFNKMLLSQKKERGREKMHSLSAAD